MTTQVLAVPKWLIVIRGIQLVLALIVLGLAAYGVYWVAFNAYGFAIFTSLATIIIVLYGILTSQITAWQSAYNYWAVVGLDAFMVVFWLSAMAAIAALRASFIYTTTVNGCGHDGGIGGGYCWKRGLSKRAVAGDGYLDMMSGAAGISAIELILFIITLVISAIALKRQRASDHANGPTTNDKLESHPMDPVQQQVPVQYQQQQYAPPAQQPQQQYQPAPVQYQQQPYAPPPQQQYQ